MTSFANPLQTLDIGLGLGQPLLEEVKIRCHAQRMILRRLLLIEKGHQRRLVGLRKNQLVPPLSLFQRIQQVVVAQLLGGETVERLLAIQTSRERLD